MQGKEAEKDLAFTSSLPQTLATVRTGPVQSQNPGTPSDTTWVSGTQVLEPSPVAFREREQEAGSEVGNPGLNVSPQHSDVEWGQT